MGHVFVPGDITRFACDAWLLPTDRTLHLARGWTDAVAGLADARDALGAEAEDLRAERTYAPALPRWDGPRPVLTAVPFHGVRDARDVTGRVAAGLAEAARVAQSTRSAGAGPWSRCRCSAARAAAGTRSAERWSGPRWRPRGSPAPTSRSSCATSATSPRRSGCAGTTRTGGGPRPTAPCGRTPRRSPGTPAPDGWCRSSGPGPPSRPGCRPGRAWSRG